MYQQFTQRNLIVKNYSINIYFLYTKTNRALNQIFFVNMHSLSSQEREKIQKHLKVKAQRWIYEDVLWKKVRRYQKIFSYIPWVRALCVCNSLAMNACHLESDIDLFIIAERNRLWTARIYLTLLTTLLGLRKTKHKHAGTFCLSFFVSLDEKKFSHIAIENDIYFAYWYETLVPIINKNKSYELFLTENNLPMSWFEYTRTEYIKKQEWLILKLLKSIWDIQETILKKIFLPKTLKSYEKLGKPFWVIITDSMLKFHNHDKRKKIRDTLI